MKPGLWIKFVSALLLVGGLTGCGPDSGSLSLPQVDVEAVLARPKAYVGSKQCEFCHLEHYDSWENTLHSRTLQDVTQNQDALIAEIDPETILADLQRLGDTLKVPADQIYIPKPEEVRYTIGMQWEQGFLVEKDQVLYVAPIQYNANSDRWINYREEDWAKRPWIQKCGGCHATGIDLEKNTFSEPSVGCEACHGPGSHHVALPETAVFQKHRTIVNPSHLPAAFRTQICGSCHSRGKSTKEKGFEWPAGYMPGRALGRYYKYTSYAQGNTEFAYPNDFAKGRYQQYNDWKKSGHAREGVTCTSCHYVHQLGVPPTQYQTKGAGSQQCLLCHKVINNNLAHSIHSFANCVGCHMPRIVENGGPGEIHSHVFKALLPRETMQNAEIPNSCQTCHYHKDTDLATLQQLYDSIVKKSLLRVHQARPRW